MSDKCEYVYIGGMRVPMENVLITFVPWNQRSAMTQSFRVVGASPGRDRGDPPYIQTISELKKLLKNNYNSKMVVNVYDPKTKSSVGEPFEFNPSKAQGRAGRRHAVKEGCSAVWSQFEPDEFVAEILAKGVSYGVSEGLDEINTAQLDWLARTPAGVTVLDNILNSTDPSMLDIKCTLAAVAADTATIVPLSSKIAEAFSKLAPLAVALGFGPETPAPPYDDEDIADDVALGIMTTDTVKFAVAPAEAVKTYEIGDVGPAGGTIFAIKSGMYLEVAPEDIGRLTWRDAVSAAQNYEHNGFSDWYLPSQNELDAMYEKRDMIGGLSTDYYWSSSEYDVNAAWYQKFFNFGDQNYNGKYFTYSVRPVRAFSI